MVVTLEDRQQGIKDCFVALAIRTITEIVLRIAYSENQEEFNLILVELEQKVEGEQEQDHFTLLFEVFATILVFMMERLFLFSLFSCLSQSMYHHLLFQISFHCYCC